MRITSSEEAKAMALDFSKSIKERVDGLLRADCANYTNLGTDSTPEERQEVKGISKEIYQVIAAIDKESGKILVDSIDN